MDNKAHNVKIVVNLLTAGVVCLLIIAHLNLTGF